MRQQESLPIAIRVRNKSLGVSEHCAGLIIWFFIVPSHGLKTELIYLMHGHCEGCSSFVHMIRNVLKSG